jgi:hypothetical protein
MEKDLFKDVERTERPWNGILLRELERRGQRTRVEKKTKTEGRYQASTVFTFRKEKELEKKSKKI